MNKSILVLQQSLGKNVKDWTLEDLDKLIQSHKDMLLKIEVVQALIDSGNPVLVEALTPVYFNLAYMERMKYLDQQLGQLQTGTEEGFRDKFISELKSDLESDNALVISTSAYLLLKLFSDSIDLRGYEEKIKESLSSLEKICTLIPIPDGYELLESYLNMIYFPLINEWEYKYNEKVIEYDEDFKAKLEEMSAFSNLVMQTILKDKKEKDDDNNEK